MSGPVTIGSARRWFDVRGPSPLRSAAHELDRLRSEHVDQLERVDQLDRVDADLRFSTAPLPAPLMQRLSAPGRLSPDNLGPYADFVADPKGSLQKIYTDQGQAGVDAFLGALDLRISQIQAQLPIGVPSTGPAEAARDDFGVASTDTSETANHRAGAPTPQTAALRSELSYLKYLRTLAVAAAAELKAETAALVADFEQQALADAHPILDVSEARAQAAYEAYGLDSKLSGGVFTLRPEYTMNATPQSEELAAASSGLLEKREALEDAQAQLRAALLERGDPKLRSQHDLGALKQMVADAQREHDQLLAHLCQYHPVLGSISGGNDALSKLKTLAAGASSAAAKILSDALSRTLDGVRGLRARLTKEPGSIWKLPEAVQASLRRNPKYAENSLAGQAVRDAIAERTPWPMANAAKMAMYFGLGLVAVAIPGAAGLGVLALSELLAAHELVVQFDEYELVQDAFEASGMSDSPLAKKSPSAVILGLSLAGSLAGLKGLGSGLKALLRSKGVLRTGPQFAAEAFEAEARLATAAGKQTKAALEGLDVPAQAALIEAQSLRRLGRHEEAAELLTRALPDARRRFEVDLRFRVHAGELPGESLRLLEAPDKAARLLDALGGRTQAVLHDATDVEALLKLLDVDPRAISQSGLRASDYVQARASAASERVFDEVMAAPRLVQDLGFDKAMALAKSDDHGALLEIYVKDPEGFARPFDFEGQLAGAWPSTGLKKLAEFPAADVDVLLNTAAALKGAERFTVALSKLTSAELSRVAATIRRVARGDEGAVAELMKSMTLSKTQARAVTGFVGKGSQLESSKLPFVGHKEWAAPRLELKGRTDIEALPEAFIKKYCGDLQHVLHDPKIPLELRRQLRGILVEIDASKAFTNAGVRSWLKEVKTKNAERLADHILELKVGLRFVEEGRVKPGTKIELSAKTGKGKVVDLGGGHRVDMAGQEGKKVMAEADLLFVDANGIVRAVEVKKSVFTLQKKLEKDVDYAEAFDNWRESGGPSSREVEYAVVSSSSWRSSLIEKSITLNGLDKQSLLEISGIRKTVASWREFRDWYLDHSRVAETLEHALERWEKQG